MSIFIRILLVVGAIVLLAFMLRKIRLAKLKNRIYSFLDWFFMYTCRYGSIPTNNVSYIEIPGI